RGRGCCWRWQLQIGDGNVGHRQPFQNQEQRIILEHTSTLAVPSLAVNSNRSALPSTKLRGNAAPSAAPRILPQRQERRPSTPSVQGSNASEFALCDTRARLGEASRVDQWPTPPCLRCLPGS